MAVTSSSILDGSPQRTFCYAADAVTGYYKVLVKGQSGEAYNIGVEEPEISMSELAERLTTAAKELFDYTGSCIRQGSQDATLIDNPNKAMPDNLQSAGASRIQSWCLAGRRTQAVVDLVQRESRCADA